MADAPSPPWNLCCPWCDFYVVVNARGQRGADPGSGVQAAELMQDHIAGHQGKTWQEFLATTGHE